MTKPKQAKKTETPEPEAEQEAPQMPDGTPIRVDIGPHTIKPNITAYEAALLNLLVVRVLQGPMVVDDLNTYPYSAIRHVNVVEADPAAGEA